MQKLFLLCLVLAGTYALSACSDEKNETVGNGDIWVNLESNSDINVLTRALGEDSNAPEENDFTIYISGLLENKTLTYEEAVAGVTLKTGTYNVKAIAGDPSAEGFIGKEGYTIPWYQGDAIDIEIKGGVSTPVNLSATLQNAKITVTYTEEFKKYAEEYGVISTVESSKGGNIFTIDMEETYPDLYLIPGTLTVNIYISSAQGIIQDLEESFLISAQTHYNLTLDMETPKGDAKFRITFEGPDTNDLGEVNLAD